MPYRMKIRNALPELSKSFLKLADFILDYYIEVAFLTASELAGRLNVDPATVVRFSQFVGYEGYPDLLQDIRHHVKNDLLIRQKQDENLDSIPDVVASTIEEVKSAIEQTQISMDTNALNLLIDKIVNARRILVVAEGPAQLAAYNLIYSLELGDIPVYRSHPGLPGIARTIHNATSQDVLIAIDFANDAPYIASALREARAKGTWTVIISGAPSLPSTRSADIVLSARGYPDVGIQIIVIETIIYTLIQTLQRTYPERFEGAKQAISELSSLLQ